MIRLTIILLTSSFLFACQSTNRKPVAPLASNFKTLDTVVPFAGFWVNETYVKNVKRTGSPREFQGISEGCLTIPARTLQPTCMVAGFHEGGPGMVVVKKDNSFQFYYKKNDTVSQLAYDIQVVAANKLKIGQHTFIKTDEHFLADILFSGEYKDTLGTTIQFSKDGHVKGLGNYAVYDPICDYMGPGMEVDEVDMGQSSKNMDHFGFKFSHDTLYIHNLNCLVRDSSDNSCMEASLGEIKYKLIRIH